EGGGGHRPHGRPAPQPGAERRSEEEGAGEEARRARTRSEDRRRPRQVSAENPRPGEEGSSQEARAEAQERLVSFLSARSETSPQLLDGWSQRSCGVVVALPRLGPGQQLRGGAHGVLLRI